jgi:hypothetical protein
VARIGSAAAEVLPKLRRLRADPEAATASDWLARLDRAIARLG